MTIETKRLNIVTNIKFQNNDLLYPDTPDISDIFKIKSNDPEDGCFVFYDKNSGKKVGVIHFTDKRREHEIKYTTEDAFRRKGFMKEALFEVLKLIFLNTSWNAVYALINDNLPSVRTAKSVGFVEDVKDNFGSWFILRKP